MILEQGELIDFLGMENADRLAEVMVFAAAAESAWLASGLPGASATRTDQLDGGSRALVLYGTPVITVTSITEGPTAAVVDPAGVLVQRSAGVLTRISGGSFLSPVTVSYTWGFATVPPDIRHALKLLTRHLWTTQRGSSKRPGDATEVSVAYTWPNRVLELAKPYMPGGFA